LRAISSGVCRSSASTATPTSIPGTERAKVASVYRPLAPGWSFDHIET
jgi:hypothetical protein